MFEQKINTVSIRVNEESFAVVPFDTHEDAIKAAKQALVALNGGDAMQSLIDRLCSVEMALSEEQARNTTVLRIDGGLLSGAFTEFKARGGEIKELNEGVCDPIVARVACKTAAHDLGVAGVLSDVLASREDLPEKEPVAWMLKKAKGVPGAVTNDKGLLAVWMNEECEIVPLYE